MWAASLAIALAAANINVTVRLLGSLAVFFIFILPGEWGSMPPRC